MPNHVRTDATITGPEASVRAFAARHFTIKDNDPDDNPAEARSLGFDFDTVIKRPACLDGITAGSQTEKAVEALTGRPYSEAISGLHGAMLRSIRSQFPPRPLPTVADCTPEELEQGRRALAAIAECGSATWYDWSIEHWGCKWNAYDTTPPALAPMSKRKGYQDAYILRFGFDSAWDTPRPIWAKLAEMYPDLAFVLKLSGEIDEPETIRLSASA